MKINRDDLKIGKKSRQQGSGWSVVSHGTLNGESVIVKEQTKEIERAITEEKVLAMNIPNVVSLVGIVKDGNGPNLLVIEKLDKLPVKLDAEKAKEYIFTVMSTARDLYLRGITWVARIEHLGISKDGKIKVFDFNDDQIHRDEFLPPKDSELYCTNVMPLLIKLCELWDIDSNTISCMFIELVKNEYQELVNVHQPIYFDPCKKFERRDPDTKKIQMANRNCLDRYGFLYKKLNDGKDRSLLDIGSDAGWFCYALQEKGFKTTGVEFDPKKVEFCKMLSGIFVSDNEPIFKDANFNLEYVKKMQNYDVILALSVLHWHLYNAPDGSGQVSLGLGVQQFTEFFKELTKKANQCLIFEIPHKAILELGLKNHKELCNWAKLNGGFKDCYSIGTSDAKRELIFCEK